MISNDRSKRVTRRTVETKKWSTNAVETPEKSQRTRIESQKPCGADGREVRKAPCESRERPDVRLSTPVDPNRRVRNWNVDLTMVGSAIEIRKKSKTWDTETPTLKLQRSVRSGRVHERKTVRNAYATDTVPVIVGKQSRPTDKNDRCSCGTWTSQSVLRTFRFDLVCCERTFLRHANGLGRVLDVPRANDVSTFFWLRFSIVTADDRYR